MPGYHPSHATINTGILNHQPILRSRKASSAPLHYPTIPPIPYQENVSSLLAPPPLPKLPLRLPLPTRPLATYLSLRSLLFIAVLGLHTPANRSSHSSSSWLSNCSSIGSRLLISSSFSQLTPTRMRFVSRMNLPTLYFCDSCAASTYFHPRLGGVSQLLPHVHSACPTRHVTQHEKVNSHTPTNPTANIRNRMQPGHQIPRHRPIQPRIRQTRRPLRLPLPLGPLHQIRATVPPREALADDLRSKAQIRAALRAVQARSVTREQGRGWGQDGRGGRGRRCGRGGKRGG
jgi:hypothetical protein